MDNDRELMLPRIIQTLGLMTVKLKRYIQPNLQGYILIDLTWSVHIEKVFKKISAAIGALKCIRSFITTKTAVQVHFALTDTASF